MATMEEKDKQIKIAFAGDWINRRWTEEEMDEKRAFYAWSGIKVFRGIKK